ncbi:guanine nucleotide exchange factor [Spathaspora passalidarum NRRL Y-27907]|uniref:Guanine nucleotide exchange factor n=1 Tax=Spathaspora passalidarum (strain NRRL Y-27907 / 11-Y1) TaxID=619300 RepID=G3AEY6_SPAPN|nr:guanine nucleotide exchange factor [Spathaspora passalidarum NRRL Y-27907]EGW34790.1 guanine nucleotide exchange factor [Spathaspora passalidarum NRRL Y-27907]
MVWINGCPQFSIDSPITHEDIIQIIHIPHTPLVTILTPTSVYIFHQFTLLPLTSHVRSPTSIENNGKNLELKVKHVSVNTSKFQKLNTVNLFIQTDSNYLIIYQCQINYSKSLYEVHNSNNELIQTGLPLSDTSLKFSLSGLIKSATKSIIHGNEESLVNLENIESINNASLEDELGNSAIEFVKISIFKILKIGIKLQNFWLQQNSHYLIIFNNNNTDSEDKTEDSRFQVVNIFNFKTDLFQSSEFSWYKQNSKITYIKFNVFFNYFLFVNRRNELWIMEFDKENKEITTKGHKLLIFEEEEELTNIQFWFNPQCQLIIIRVNHELRMYKMEQNTIELLKVLDENASPNLVINWSPCGAYFVITNPNTGYWKLCSKFGNVTFNSEETLQELDDHPEENRKFLKASIISISGNAMNLYLLSHDKSKLFFINLVRIISDAQRGLLYDNEYISIIQNNRNLIRFPILPKFKKFLSNQEIYNGNINKSIKSATGKFSLARNDFNQISISYGDCLSVSTPYCSGDDKINHILWFNFKSYFAESMNIVKHFWFKDYLLVVNRKSKHAFTDDDNPNSVDSNDHLVDEFIVFDTSSTRYGMGGEDISFNSDSLLWKYDFKTTFVDIQIGTDVQDKQTCHVVIVTSDYRLIVLDLTMDKTITIKNDETKFYKIFISVRKTILLSSIKNKVNLDDVIQTSMVNNRHFLFLLDTGDLYLLKNQQSNRQGSVISNSSMHSGGSTGGNNLYDLIKLNVNIEFFKFKTIRFNKSSIIDFIYLFNSEHILIYDINELIDKSYDKSIQTAPQTRDMLIGDDYDDELHPILIESQGMHPIKLDSILEIGQDTYKSLDLIGLESFAIYKQTTGGLLIKNRVAHKLILNNFIEFDLLHKGDLESSFYKYKQFKNFHYCLELLLFKNLTLNQSLKRLCQLIEFTDNAEYIYINCLRKIEADYWPRFFDVLETTPVKFMNRLIEIDNVELCYNYLIIYLNYKTEDETKKDQLNSDDIQVILKIIKMLDKSGRWDWCFELCRFIKLLEPTGNLLVKIQQELSQ